MSILLAHENCVFEDQTVVVTGGVWIDCTFTRCTLIFTSLGDWTISGGVMSSCVFHFDFTVSDHKQWAKFMDGIGKQILGCLPRELGDESKG